MDINQSTREEWRKLGFFYDHDDKTATWKFVGSKSGLLKFCDIIESFTADPANNKISQHEAYGPYGYLTLETWDSPLVDCMTIKGTIAELNGLSNLIKEKLKTLNPPAQFTINEEYSPHNDYFLVFELKEEGFDPASADPLLNKKVFGR